MADWGGVCMAFGAFAVAGMVEASGFPFVGGMTLAALAFVMVYRRCFLVAGFTIGVAGVVEVDDVPIFGVAMAVYTTALVVLWRCVLDMAAFTFRDVLMGIAEDSPIFNVCVAQHTFAGIVRLG
jgi:hypothetical protein